MAPKQAKPKAEAKPAAKAAPAPKPAAPAPAKAAAKQPAAAAAAPAKASKPAPKAPAKAAKAAKKTRRGKTKPTVALVTGLNFYGQSKATIRAYFRQRCGKIYHVSAQKKFGKRVGVKIWFRKLDAAKRCAALNGYHIKGNKIGVKLIKDRAPKRLPKFAKSIFVSGLPSGTGKKQLRRHFRTAGQITRVRVYKSFRSVFQLYHPRNRHRPANSGRRGWHAFVYFKTSKAARRAQRMKARAYKPTVRAPQHKLHISLAHRTIQKDKRRAEWRQLVTKVFNPRVQQREQQERQAKEAKKAEEKKAAKKAEPKKAPAKEAAKPAAKPEPKKAAPAPAKEEPKKAAAPAPVEKKAEPKAAAKPAAKPAAKGGKK